jgi:hypothetical protein
LAAHKFFVSGATIAVIALEGSFTLMVSVPVVLPAAIVNGEQVTPGIVPHATTTALANPPLGVTVIADVPVAIVPEVLAVVVTIAGPAAIVKVPTVA